MKKFDLKKNLKVIIIGAIILSFAVYSVITADIRPADNNDTASISLNKAAQSFETDTAPGKESKDKKAKEKKEKKKKTSKKTAKNKNSKKSSSKKSASSSRPAPRSNHKSIVNKSKKYTCYISIDCLTVFDNWDKLKSSKKNIIPKSGYMLSNIKVTFNEGESPYDVLLRTARNKGIHLDTEYTAAYNAAYIRGIGNLYEKDCGAGSGWSYLVNGWSPNYGCSRYTLKEGDRIQFRYSCKTGNDI